MIVLVIRMLNDHNFKCNFSTLTVFTFLFRNTPPPRNLNHIQSSTRQWRARFLWQAALHPTLGLRWPCQSGAVCRLKIREAARRGTLPPRGGAHVLQRSPPALGRRDQPLTGARAAAWASRMLSFRGAGVAFPTANGKTGMILHTFLAKTASGKPIIMQTAILIK